MGLQRLLCGALQCYSGQLRLVFRAASMCTQTSPSTSSTVTSLRGLCGGIFTHTNRLGTAHRQLITRRSLSTFTQPSRDVILFECDRTLFFRFVSFFCGTQGLFWTYLSYLAYTQFRPSPSDKEKDKTSTTTTTTTTGLAGIFNVDLGSSTWRYGFTLSCLTIGALMAGCGFVLCRRYVYQVILHKGGGMVTLLTQSPLGAGRGRKVTVPLYQVAGQAHRDESPSFIPVKIKGHKMFFLLDKNGTIKNERLFDVTVGAYRSL